MTHWILPLLTLIFVYGGKPDDPKLGEQLRTMSWGKEQTNDVDDDAMRGMNEMGAFSKEQSAEKDDEVRRQKIPGKTHLHVGRTTKKKHGQSAQVAGDQTGAGVGEYHDPRYRVPAPTGKLPAVIAWKTQHQCPRRFNMGCVLDVAEKVCEATKWIGLCLAKGNCAPNPASEDNGACELDHVKQILGVADPESLWRCCCTKAYERGYEKCQYPDTVCGTAVKTHIDDWFENGPQKVFGKCVEVGDLVSCKASLAKLHELLVRLQKVRGSMWEAAKKSDPSCTAQLPNPLPYSKCGFANSPPRSFMRTDLYCESIIWQYVEMGEDDYFLPQCGKLPETPDAPEMQASLTGGGHGGDGGHGDSDAVAVFGGGDTVNSCPKVWLSGLVAGWKGAASRWHVLEIFVEPLDPKALAYQLDSGSPVYISTKSKSVLGRESHYLFSGVPENWCVSKTLGSQDCELSFKSPGDSPQNMERVDITDEHTESKGHEWARTLKQYSDTAFSCSPPTHAPTTFPTTVPTAAPTSAPHPTPAPPGFLWLPTPAAILASYLATPTTTKSLHGT